MRAAIIYQYKQAMLVVEDRQGTFATLPRNNKAWRPVNLQQLKEFLTLPQHFDKINFASDEHLSSVRPSPPRKRGNFYKSYVPVRGEGSPMTMRGNL